MKTIILSAGQGTRLLPMTKDRPKCLLEVAEGVTILGWQLAQLAAAGISDVVVVTGYEAEKVEREIENYRNLLNVRTLFNAGFDQMDNLGSAWQARDEMNEDFIILNGDTLFTTPVVERLCAAAPASVRTTISKKAFYDEDDMKVVLDEDRLTAIGKQLDNATVNAESIGMILFRGEGVSLFREAACEAMAERRPNENRYYLSLIDKISRSHRVDVTEVSQQDWSEVDFPGDFVEARNGVRRWKAEAITATNRTSIEPSSLPSIAAER